MTKVSEAAVREVVEQYQDDLIRDLDRYEHKAYDSLIEVILPARPKAFSLGIALLRLGECARGREWLAISPSGSLDRLDRTDPAEAYRPGEQGGTVSASVVRSFRRALHGALLSRDNAVVTATGKRSRSLLTELGLSERDDPLVGLLSAHAAVLVGDTEQATDRLETALNERARLAERKDNLELELAMLHAAIHADATELHEAAEAHLDAHREAVLNDVHDTVWRCVDYPAAGFVSLARERGTEAQIDTEFIPDCVYESG